MKVKLKSCKTWAQSCPSQKMYLHNTKSSRECHNYLPVYQIFRLHSGVERLRVIKGEISDNLCTNRKN